MWSGDVVAAVVFKRGSHFTDHNNNIRARCWSSLWEFFLDVFFLIFLPFQTGPWTWQHRHLYPRFHIIEITILTSNLWKVFDLTTTCLIEKCSTSSPAGRLCSSLSLQTETKRQVDYIFGMIFQSVFPAAPLRWLIAQTILNLGAFKTNKEPREIWPRIQSRRTFWKYGFVCHKLESRFGREK